MDTCRSEKTLYDYPNFFIIGVQRSGTSLLRLILNNHSDISVPEETTFLMPFIRRKVLLNKNNMTTIKKINFVNYLKKNSQYKKWRLDESDLNIILDKDLSLRQAIGYLYYIYKEKYKKNICGDKNPSFIRKINLLSKAFPNAKFIYIIRDGRDIYLSLKKRGHPSTSSIALSSFEWNYKISLINSSLKELSNRYFKVRYEDLIQSPEEIIKKICVFLGVSYEQEMLNFWKSSLNHIEKEHSELIDNPINPQNAYKWREEMTNSEIKKFDYFSRENLKLNEYQIHNKPLRNMEKFKYICELLVNIPFRIAIIIKIDLFMKVASKFGLAVNNKYYAIGSKVRRD